MTLDEFNAQLTAHMDEMLEHAKEVQKAWMEKTMPLIEQAIEAGIDEHVMLVMITVQKQRAEKAAENVIADLIA